MKYNHLPTIIFLVVILFTLPLTLLSSPSMAKRPAASSAWNKQFLPMLGSEFVPGATIFADEFEDESYTLAHWLPMGGEWDVVNGRYVYSTTGMSVTGKSWWGDYTFMVDVLGIDVIDKIIDFRYVSNDEAYGIDIRSNPYDDVVLVKNYPNQAPKTLKSVKRVNYNDAWYSIKIVLAGARIQIFINDLLAIDYLDTTSPIVHGKIGVGGMLSLESKVLYDHVRVSLSE